MASTTTTTGEGWAGAAVPGKGPLDDVTMRRLLADWLCRPTADHPARDRLEEIGFPLHAERFNRVKTWNDACALLRSLAMRSDWTDGHDEVDLLGRYTNLFSNWCLYLTASHWSQQEKDANAARYVAAALSGNVAHDPPGDIWRECLNAAYASLAFA